MDHTGDAVRSDKGRAKLHLRPGLACAAQCHTCRVYGQLEDFVWDMVGRLGRDRASGPFDYRGSATDTARALIDLGLFALMTGLVEHGAVSGPNMREVLSTFERLSAEQVGALRERLTQVIEDLKAVERGRGRPA